MNIANEINNLKGLVAAAFKAGKTANERIDALPQPMQYKGTLGVGGKIQTLPTPSAENNGWVYKVITKGTYAGQEAKPGDTFTSDGEEWGLTPSGDDVFLASDELEAGETSITFTDDRITAESFISVASEAWYTASTQTTGSVTLTFPEQASDMLVQIMVAN